MKIRPLILALIFPLLSAGTTHAQEGAAVLDARAQAFGFASRLTADTDMALGVRNLKSVLDGVAESNFWKRFVGVLDDFGSADFVNQEGVQFRAVVDQTMGTDAFIAFTEGSTAEFQRLAEGYNFYNRVTYRAIAAGMRAGMMGGAEIDMENVIAEALTMEDGKLLKILQEIQAPPIIAGCRVDEGGDQILQQLDGLTQTAPPFLVVESVEVPGAGTFKSWRIAAKDAVDEGSRQELRDNLNNEEISKKIEAAIDNKVFEFCYGKVGNYLIFSFGKDRSHLKFAANPGESLVSRDEFAFADQFLQKKLVAWSFAEDEMMKLNTTPESITSLFDGMAEGLTAKGLGGPEFSATAAALQKFGGSIGALISKISASHRLGVVYAENGLHGEAIGGTDAYGYDLDKELSIIDALPEDAFMKYSGAETLEVREDGIAIIESLAAVVDEGMKVAAKVESGDMAQFGAMYQQFAPVLRPKLISLWDIMKNSYIPAFGTEGAMAIDLKGSMPQLKGIAPVPPVFIDQGRMPRIVAVAEVKDRAKLTESWEKLVPLINETIATFAGGAGPQGAPTVPEPMSSEANGIKTHFFMIPFLSNDFLPCVSISDSLFLLGTSKTLNEEIAAKVKPSGKKGAYFEMNIEQLREFGTHWLKLVNDNAKDLFGGDEFAAEDFTISLGPAQLALDFADAIDSVKISVTKEGDDLRTSWHLALEDIEASVD
ncbi:MAG: hypothetical protein AAGA58_11205 [Verrucomicrobiota bacterium]